jgi:uncharacterized protein (DUF488 family)
MDPESEQSAFSVATIGYEGKTLADYMDQLTEANITLLCDVRQNAVSRKKGFSKRALSIACAEAGIRYEHLPELGIPSADRKAVRSDADRAALFDRYRETLAKAPPPALDQIRSWIVDGRHRVALTCFEARPEECHRHCVAEVLAEREIGHTLNL